MGRRFPFGGRCSLFENVWKRKSRTAAALDWVEARSELLFRGLTNSGQGKGPPVGIPRALTTHSLYPLYSTFFVRLGIQTVLSGIDPRGELKSYSGFCFPIQIAHGAVLDLLGGGVDRVFVPQVMRMPRCGPRRESYLCPVTQASPYFLAKAYPNARFLSPLLDFTNGYEAASGLVEMAVRELGFDREHAERAWKDAVRAQTDAEGALKEMGQQALRQAVAEGKPAIVLAGHSYNAFTPEGSQSVGKKLASMGVTAIPADCLAPRGEGPTSWHFANQVVNAMALAKEHPNLFLLCVSNFSCTVDAFTQSMMTSEMGSKPYLILEIDAHTADAGVQTRLEAFLDIIHNYRQAERTKAVSFTPCRLTTGGRVLTSDGQRVPLGDPRVKLYFPNFSPFHSQALAMALGWLGLNPGETPLLGRHHLEAGLRHTSGRECLPLPICVGQLLEIHERLGPGEMAGFYMLGGGAPCVVDAYRGTLERFIAEQRWSNVFLLIPEEQNDYCGFKKSTLLEHLAPVIPLADIMVEVEQVLKVAGTGDALDRFRGLWRRLVATAGTIEQFHAELPGFIDRLALLPRRQDPKECPRVLVTGDFFTRFSPFFMENVYDLYAQRGIILKPVDLSDLFLYGSFYAVAETARAWGMQPGGLALARACTRILRPDGKQYMEDWLTYQAEKKSAERYRGLFRKTGLLVAGSRDVPLLFAKASEHVSPTIFGETIPTVGDGVQAEAEGYDGIILIGPFNCLPFRISEAILKPLSMQHGMPIFTYESDGYGVSAANLRQVDVHTQQVLEHAARKRTVPRPPAAGSPAFA